MATSSVFALTRVHPGFYKTEIGGVTVHVTKHTGRSWSASRGSHAWTKWSAVVPALIPEVLKTDGAHESEIAQGSTLAQCRKHLERYAADFAAFETWCAVQGLASMPATPAVVAVYLAQLADNGRKVATIERALTGIVHAHRSRGFDWPRAHPAIANVMAGIRRRIGTAPSQKAPVVDELLGAMLATLNDDLRGLRDRALLTLGWACSFNQERC